MTHFYCKNKNGKVEPRHFVPMAKDPTRTRPSRVTDAKKAAKNGEVWYPSVTTVLNILDKPALVNWKVDQHLQTAFEIDRRAFDHGFDAFKQDVKRETQERMDLAPKAGTDIHQVLEDWVGDRKIPDSEMEKLICLKVDAVLEECCGEQFWLCEEYFAENGYAGCADLIAFREPKGSKDNWVIDYKSKQTADKFKPGKMQYPDHVRQLAAYGKALFPDMEFRAANIFICLESGEVDFCEVDHSKLEDGYLDFMDCLSIYKRNTYNPDTITD